MKILLIDDQALKGWKQILEAVLFKNISIEFAENFDVAKDKLETNIYDLIFLDLRLNENDHNYNDIKQFNGFKIISEIIRNDFNSINFPTPVIIFSATNKIWNIDKMIDHGADSYYIKEHPDYSYNAEYSKENFVILKNNTIQLLNTGAKRRRIWLLITEIEKLLLNISNVNIRNRINEKLKIGYGLLFRRTTEVENQYLIFNNQVISFIVFWSILEEIVKDSFIDNWIKSGDDEGKMKNNKWVLKNRSIFVEDLITYNANQKQGGYEVGIKYNITTNLYESNKHIIDINDSEISFYKGKISLSLQVYAVLLLGKNWTPTTANSKFSPLNDYRNKIDFIHSSTNSIFNKNLSKKDSEIEGYNKCIEMLNFIKDILQ
ncbi:hypothetical protein Flavo103_02460 [Flavobacterium collinsii]|uniref:response regulator n=1 Tax=Flavobacterium collinsii TaxID=1114861 RepID=UPI0022C0DB05|nr:response regulator [Flavobacterium collinsii]GIQ57110.1 hypothetical protein Flavo103_02460 [Flavobacterium collinsii]